MCVPNRETDESCFAIVGDYKKSEVRSSLPFVSLFFLARLYFCLTQYVIKLLQKDFIISSFGGKNAQWLGWLAASSYICGIQIV